MDITASYIISGKKNAPKSNPAKITITVMNGVEKAADITLVYINKTWTAASKIDLHRFFVCISGGAPVARLEDYINSAWNYAVTCASCVGKINPHKWDMIAF
jgi:hypothetical protein